MTQSQSEVGVQDFAPPKKWELRILPLSASPNPFPIWKRWIAVSGLAFLVSLLVIEVGEKPELGAIEGIIGGCTIGLAQAVLLSTYLPQAWQWALVNLIGWGLMGGSGFGAIGWFAPHTQLLPLRFLAGIVVGAIGGLWLGIWHWLVLKKQIPGAWRWITIEVLAWSIGLSIGWTVGGILRLMTHLFLGEVIGLIVTWIIVATITGTVLRQLFSRYLLPI
jgi:hypothetical protein